MPSNRLAGIAAAFLLAACGLARASTHVYTVLLDTDLNSGTGCTVATPQGAFPGVEQLLVTTVVTTTTGAAVSAVQQRTCGGGVFGPPAAAPPAAIPALLPLGFAVLIGMFAVLGARATRRFAGVARAMALVGLIGIAGLSIAVVLDGLVNDWTGVGPLGTSPAGDAPPNADLLALYARNVGGEPVIQ